MQISGYKLLNYVIGLAVPKVNVVPPKKRKQKGVHQKFRAKLIN